MLNLIQCRPYLLLASLALAVPAQADAFLTTDELGKLLNNNTIVATSADNKSILRFFFSADGSVKKSSNKGESGQGTWHTESGGRLCADFGEGPVCGPITSLGDGRYKRMRDNPRSIMGASIHMFTIERIESGDTFDQ